MSDTSGNVISDPTSDEGELGEHEESVLPREQQLEQYLKGLFDVPSKNIESAFELLLGLVKEHSSEINSLKKAHSKSLDKCDEVRVQLQREHIAATDEWEREKSNLLEDIQKLKLDHEILLDSHEKANSVVDELRNEIKTLAFNFQGFDEDRESEDDSSSSGESDNDVVENADAAREHESDIRDAVEHLENEKSRQVRWSLQEKSAPTSPDAMESSREEEQRNEDAAIQRNDIPTLQEESIPSSSDALGSVREEEERKNDLELLRNATSARERAISIVKVKLDADRTVAARLDRLENTHLNLIEGLSDVRQLRRLIENNDTRAEHAAEVVEKISNRLGVVEIFLQGFEQVDSNRAEDTGIETDEEPFAEENDIDVIDEGGPSCNAEARPLTPDAEVVNEEEEEEQEKVTEEVKEEEQEEEEAEEAEEPFDIDNLERHYDPRNVRYSQQLKKSNSDLREICRGSLLSHLTEREARTELSIVELTHQIGEIKVALLGQQSVSKSLATKVGVSADEMSEKIVELSGGLQGQVAELMTVVNDKVSMQAYDAEMKSIRKFIDDCGNSHVTELPHEFWIVKGQIMEQIDYLKSTKLDKESFERELEKLGSALKSSLDEEISKQQLYISTNAEQIAGELIEYRNLIDGFITAQEVPSEPEDLDERIQHATDAMKVSLEEVLEKRLDELKTIEKELDGLAAELAEKPSQDQIDSMFRGLERAMSDRLKRDKTLQLIIENMKLEMKQKMTKGEVMLMIKHIFDEAKLGIQNTKDALMVGRISYTRCLGCNQPVPEGVHGRRASKVNHDALPVRIKSRPTPMTSRSPLASRSTVASRSSLASSSPLVSRSPLSIRSPLSTRSYSNFGKRERVSSLYSRGRIRPLQTYNRSVGRPKSMVTIKFANYPSPGARGRNVTR